MGSDKLFVIVNDKIFKDDGLLGYITFLYGLNITHEEFVGFLESVYSNNVS